MDPRLGLHSALVLGLTCAVAGCAAPPAVVGDTDLPSTVEALVSCSTGDACVGEPTTTAHASWRKDVFYPYGPGALSGDPSLVFGTDEAPAYPEASVPDPVEGGRVMVVATAAVSGVASQGVVYEPTAPGPEVEKVIESS